MADLGARQAAAPREVAGEVAAASRSKKSLCLLEQAIRRLLALEEQAELAGVTPQQAVEMAEAHPCSALLLMVVKVESPEAMAALPQLTEVVAAGLLLERAETAAPMAAEAAAATVAETAVPMAEAVVMAVPATPILHQVAPMEGMVDRLLRRVLLALRTLSILRPSCFTNFFRMCLSQKP